MVAAAFVNPKVQCRGGGVEQIYLSWQPGHSSSGRRSNARICRWCARRKVGHGDRHAGLGFDRLTHEHVVVEINRLESGV